MMLSKKVLLAMTKVIGTLSLVVLVIGFVITPVISGGFFSAWQRSGFTNYVIFLSVGTLFLGLIAFFRCSRILLAALILWGVAIYGFGPIISVLFLILSAWSLGSIVKWRSDETSSRSLDQLIICIVVGLAVLLSIFQILAHLPLNCRLTYILILSLPIVVRYRQLGSLLISLGQALNTRSLIQRDYFFFTIITMVLIIHSVYVALPEAFHDALATHLMVPIQMASRGKWDFDYTSYVWALMPMGADYLYTIGNIIGGEYSARLTNFAFFILTISLLVCTLHKHFPLSYALLMGALLASTPVAFIETASLFVENALAMFLFSSFLILTQSWDEPTPYSIVSLGFCMGAATSVKLQAIPPVVFMGTLMLMRCKRNSQKISFRWALIIFSLIALVTGLVPYLYSLHQTGNPVFPFFNGIFLSPYYPPVNFVDSRWIGNIKWSLLFDLTFNSHLFGELYDGSFGFQHLLLLPVSILGAIIMSDRLVVVSLMTASIYIISVVSNTQYIRYIYPVFPFLSLVEAFSLPIIFREKLVSILPTALVYILIILNLLFMPTGGWILGTFKVTSIFDENAKNQYLRQMVPERSLNEVVNSTHHLRSRVLYLSSPFGAGLQGIPVYANWYNPRLVERISSSASLKELSSVMREYGITHVIADEMKLKDLSYGDRMRELLANKGLEIETVANITLYRLDNL